MVLCQFQQSAGRVRWSVVVLLGVVLCAAESGLAQDATEEKKDDSTSPAAVNTPSAPSGPVTVQPLARDEDIRQRIQKILEATGEYTDAQVSVKQGVVFLKGRAKTDRLKEWAGTTSGKVEDVVAVFNGLEVLPPSPWDFTATIVGLEDLWRSFLGASPLFVFGLLTLFLAGIAALFSTRVLRWSMQQQIASLLLRDVLARFGGFLFFLVGVYIILQVAGLARLALTVVGGTGLVGLAIGIAFRDITENFLSSVFLSIQRPFQTGDLLDVAGTLGYVERVTSRNTVLMTLDGNMVQIPNATVYKSTLRNFSSNPNRREDFVVGIGYENMVPKAQEVALKVLTEHPAILADPEPWVLVDNFGKATVDLRVYFWLDGSKHSWLKVKSSVMRLVKRAFQENSISIPDEAREIIFPKGLDIRSSRPPMPSQVHVGNRSVSSANPPQETAAIATAAEGGLHSEAEQIEEQAQQSRSADEANLLNQNDDVADSK
ncbi:MAG TPA: mechanosensitive ion channel [Planctomycetaceae bacterium]|nr:mechanosensitive ion channel [Planctomycetaceae bacterium]